MKSIPGFWITNVSKYNITLADLALNIKSYTSINLLDKKHYSYTIDQLIKSMTSGSIFKKRNKIIVRDTILTKNVEELNNKNQVFNKEDFPLKERSTIVVDQIEYEELKISSDDQKKQDELYAQSIVDLELADNEKT